MTVVNLAFGLVILVLLLILFWPKIARSFPKRQTVSMDTELERIEAYLSEKKAKLAIISEETDKLLKESEADIAKLDTPGISKAEAIDILIRLNRRQTRAIELKRELEKLKEE